ncbi:polyphosphate polymerase domain-containing protein [Aquibacillus rhizosphaerae]|uniref:Polyphosphate polymerase domain-containing protein n=1 Tax=Aquibacillus rhizosphaerae TaxID=3051431 RepID=A0ABT7L779_9BACI|nr:polyphosphate polymerase domain-containing protein [Aquibacillus sp. LR5S19]MDL4841249.1 polyphosphate polymerase domain-containing protein [Aquibacillus sp. LR5S19]
MFKKRKESPKGRRELKHAITKLDCFLLRNNLRHIMDIDPHTNSDGKYLIRSVYFDNSENKVLTEKKEGHFNRDKFHVRLYNHQTYYINLEKKSKRNNATFKDKCRMTPAEYERIKIGDIDWMEDDQRKLIRDLYTQMVVFQLKPITVVDYEREVFIYPYGNVRITFDSSIKTSFRNNDLLNPDLAMVEALEPDIVILEVKYDEYIPDTIKRLLRVSDRRLGTYSKYHLSRMYG